MKRIVVREAGGPEVLKLEDAPALSPGPSEVLVKLHAAGVNPVETYVREGKNGYVPKLPYTPGDDGAGVVVSVGGDVKHFRAGDRVYVNGSVTGTYAEACLSEAKSVHHLPDHVTFSQGAALGVPYGTAYRALFVRARALPGETVLVHGASGGVGTAAVQLAFAAGLRVLGTASTKNGREVVLEEGAAAVFDHTTSTYTHEITEFTDGHGVDIVLEMLANVNLGKDLHMLAKHGRVVVIGSRGPIEIDPRATMGKDADIRGVALVNADDAELVRIHAALGAGLETGALTPVVGEEYPLADAAGAHRAVMHGSKSGKIVLLP